MSNALERVQSYVNDGAVPLDVVQMLQRPHKGLEEISLRVSDLRALIAALEAVEKLAEQWRYKGEFGWGAWQEGHGPDPEGHVLDNAASDIRKAITEALQ